MRFYRRIFRAYRAPVGKLYPGFEPPTQEDRTPPSPIDLPQRKEKRKLPRDLRKHIPF